MLIAVDVASCYMPQSCAIRLCLLNFSDSQHLQFSNQIDVSVLGYELQTGEIYLLFPWFHFEVRIQGLNFILLLFCCGPDGMEWPPSCSMPPT